MGGSKECDMTEQLSLSAMADNFGTPKGHFRPRVLLPHWTAQRGTFQGKAESSMKIIMEILEKNRLFLGAAFTSGLLIYSDDWPWAYNPLTQPGHLLTCRQPGGACR